MVLSVATITLIGVAVVMGANVAGIFASLGGAKVYCLGRSIEKVRKTLPRILRSVNDDSIAPRLIPVDYSDLAQCVANSDLVFESSSENIIIKKQIAHLVGEVLPPQAVSCTGSSGLSIAEISECYPEGARGRFFGVHMFNPPYRMPLCELMPTEFAEPEMVTALHHYLENVLSRTVVEVKDSPAFLANRIGFHFINEAMQQAEQYSVEGGIDYIDAILGSFTGRKMPPLMTADYVGLDVQSAIVENIYQNTNDAFHDSFCFPDFAQKLIHSNRLGRKNGEGLYKTLLRENGQKRRMVYDILTGKYRDEINYRFPFAETMKEQFQIQDNTAAFKSLLVNPSKEAEICLRLLLRHMVYSLYVTRQLGNSVAAADDVMATGFHWCPPLALWQAFSAVTNVEQLIRERIGNELSIDIDELIGSVIPSKYDFRLYFS